MARIDKDVQMAIEDGAYLEASSNVIHQLFDNLSISLMTRFTVFVGKTK